MLKRIKEAVFGVPEKKDIKTGRAIVAKYKQDAGYRTSSTFKDQIKVFEKDAVVREAIIHTAMDIVGLGFEVEINDEYTLKLKSPNKVEWDAKGAIDYFNELNNLDEVLGIVTTELVAYGNSFLTVDKKLGLLHLPLEAVEKAVKVAEDVPIYEKYDIKLTGSYDSKIIKWGEFIHFRANPTSTSLPFGTGVVSGLIESYDRNTPTLLDGRNHIREAMVNGFLKMGFANELWSFPDMSDDQLEAMGETIAAMPYWGRKIATNVHGSITTSVPSRSSQYDQWLEDFFDEFIMALGNPSLKASVKSGFTEASIMGSIKMHKKKIRSFRRAIKRQVEALWKVYLEHAMFDPIEAQARLIFNEDEEIEMEKNEG